MGLTNAWNFATDPVVADTELYAKWISNNDVDCDGVNDIWETQYGYSTTDNTVPSDTVDTDGDAYSDRNEGLFGTNPKSSTLKPTWDAATEVLDSNRYDTNISIDAFPGNKYVME